MLALVSKAAAAALINSERFLIYISIFFCEP